MLVIPRYYQHASFPGYSCATLLKYQEDQPILNFIRQDSEAETAYQLAQQFITMVQTRTAEVLDSWLEDSTSSQIVDLQNFAVGIRQDYRAVRAALETEWSNGQTARTSQSTEVLEKTDVWQSEIQFATPAGSLPRLAARKLRKNHFNGGNPVFRIVFYYPNYLTDRPGAAGIRIGPGRKVMDSLSETSLCAPSRSPGRREIDAYPTDSVRLHQECSHYSS